MGPLLLGDSHNRGAIGSDRQPDDRVRYEAENQLPGTHRPDTMARMDL
jgi:hypothetical protein